ncbi:MAG: Eco57I restriction-modification methylase domain-containing protein [Promethearchaeota archaeon]
MVTAKSEVKLGAVATPYQIIRYIVQSLLQYWQKTRKLNQNLRDIHVLDPAVGDGRFLLEFAETYKTEINERNEIPLYCYGLDINSNSIQLAQTNFKKKENITTNVSLKVGNALIGFISAPSEWDKTWSIQKLNKAFFLGKKMKETDFCEVYHPFHWFLEWPNVISNNGFDLILGNPPYGISFSQEEKILFRKLYRAFDPEFESYILFLERSIHLLRNEGLLGMIIPNNLLSNYHYRNIRKFLLQNVKILKIINFDNQVFPNIHVETCAIFLQRHFHQNERENNHVQFGRIKNALNLESLPLLDQFIIQKEIWNNFHKIFLPTPDIEIQRILKKIQKNSIPLGDIVQISRGIELGFTSPLTSDTKINPEYVPLIAGRSIRKFRIDNNVRYIKFDNSNKSIFKNKSLYLQPKLLLRRIGHELVAAYDTNNYFCVCDVYILILKPTRPSFELLYLEALLNSKLMSFYLIQRFTSVKTIFPKIPIKFLRDLPLKFPLNQTKIQDKIQDLHNTPCYSFEMSSEKFKHIQFNIEQEIFSIYEIDAQEQQIINEFFN